MFLAQLVEYDPTGDVTILGLFTSLEKAKNYCENFFKTKYCSFYSLYSPTLKEWSENSTDYNVLNIEDLLVYCAKIEKTLGCNINVVDYFEIYEIPVTE